MIKFFTSFDRIDYPLRYVTVNPFTFQRFPKWFNYYGYQVKEILLDTGVDTLFHIYNLKDYPKHHINNYINIISYFNKLAKKHDIKVIVTIPDIPSDYPSREHLYPYNVIRTIEYIEYFKEKVIPRYDNVIFMPVVQGKKDSWLSLVTTYKKYYNIYKDFEIVAVGIVCVSTKYKKLANIILEFDQITDHNYHVFGPSIKAIRLVYDKVKSMYSFDSSAFVKTYCKYKYREYKNRVHALQEFLKKMPPNIIY